MFGQARHQSAIAINPSRGSAPGRSVLPVLGALAQPAEVFGDCILIAGGHRQRITAANLPGLLIVLLAAQLQFELIYVAEHLRVELFNERGVARESAGVQALHLANQFLDFTQRLRVVRDRLAKLVQFTQALLVDTLGIRRPWRRTGRSGDHGVR